MYICIQIHLFTSCSAQGLTRLKQRWPACLQGLKRNPTCRKGLHIACIFNSIALMAVILTLFFFSFCMPRQEERLSWISSCLVVNHLMRKSPAHQFAHRKQLSTKQNAWLSQARSKDEWRTDENQDRDILHVADMSLTEHFTYGGIASIINHVEMIFYNLPTRFLLEVRMAT